MGSFKLDPDRFSASPIPLSPWATGLTGEVLLHNARWFIRIRWIVVALLALSGVAGILLEPEILERFGLRSPGQWPLYLAGILAALNLGATRWVHHISTRATWLAVAANIWFQIVSDLVILTGLVYMAGATNTVASFTYLFHITMACIFFGRRDSLLVTLLSVLLFLGIVTAESMSLIPNASVLTSMGAGAPAILPTIIFVVPTVFVWLIVWYFASSLSCAVRQRDRDLEAANQRLIKADEEINLQMLRVTHDLKAPFSGIESNIQLLKYNHWNEMSEAAREIISKIDGRSANLRARIGDILTLGSLRTTRADERVLKPVQLHELLAAVVQDVKGLAESKNVSVTLGAGGMSVPCDPEQLKILFANLVANAIVYSHDGGTVEIGLDKDEAGVKVSIVDHGIGMGDQSIEHIFEDFFRTQEAASFNPSSTGLGLAIVRQVANNLQLTVVVDSEKDKGSVFQVIFPTA